MYIVSACLLGANCKYNGGNNDNEAVKDFCEGHKVLAVCPETEGGLEAPRPPAEQVRRCAACGAVDAAADCRPTGDGESSRSSDDISSESSVPEKEDLQHEVRVINKNGEDLTEYFIRGAESCLRKILDSGEAAELAVLKANSPSCGSGKIYDGTFTGTLTDGDGVFAGMLKAHGIKVITEKDLEG